MRRCANIRSDVSSGANSAFRPCPRYICFPSHSDQTADTAPCRFGANNGREQSQQNGCYSITSPASASNVGGNREAKRPGCFEVDHKLAVLRRQQRADTGVCVRRVTHSLLSLPRPDGFKICNYFEGSLGRETSPGPSKKR